MKKFIKNPWVLGIGTTVIGGVLLAFVLDWIKGIDWFSTLMVVLNFIINAVVAFLNFELRVWWILVFIALISISLFIISKTLDAKKQPVPHLF